MPGSMRRRAGKANRKNLENAWECVSDSDYARPDEARMGQDLGSSLAQASPALGVGVRVQGTTITEFWNWEKC